MTASAKYNISVDAALAGTPDLGSAVHKFTEAFSQTFSDGTGAGQINQVFSDQRTLALGTNEDLDLAGTLVNALGATVTFTAIKGIFVSADSGNGDNIEVGGAATNTMINWVGDATDQVLIEPGGAFAIVTPSAAGYAVTAGTGDLLRITNADGAASATYNIVLLGIE
jgi:hypothetical protein